VLDRGEIDLSPLTSDAGLAERIQFHPHLRWKANKVRRFRGLPALSE
jgi:hypothetical protein